MRDLQARMLSAVLDGEGLPGIAQLAAAETGGPVAILLPARGLSAAFPRENATGLRELSGYVTARLKGRATSPPSRLAAEVPVRLRGEKLGAALALEAAQGSTDEHEGVLRAVALAALTEVAIADAREEVAVALRGGLLEELRAGPIPGADAVRRAARFGCDLARGAVVMVAEAGSGRPRHVAGLMADRHPGTLAHWDESRIYAVLPARGGDDAPERTIESAREVVSAIEGHGPAAFSSFCTDPAELHRALREAELMLEALALGSGGQLAEGMGNGVYRLLLRALISDPEEVRRFYEETVAAIVAYDLQYRTELLSTLEAYLLHDCNMNATARAIYAHRHTVAYRLERVRELSGLDPSLTEDRERLGLGIKAYRIVAPSLPR